MSVTLRAVGRRVAAVLVAVLVLGILPNATGQPRSALSPQAALVYQRWLASTCIGGEEEARAAELRRYATELAPAFERAVAAGPPPEELARVRAAAAARYAERAKFDLGTVRITGLDAADLKRFKGVTAQQYVDGEVRRYVLGYRSNAVAGLGVVGGARALAVLSRLAADRRDPLAPAAREALKSLPKPKPPQR